MKYLLLCILALPIACASTTEYELDNTGTGDAEYITDANYIAPVDTEIGIETITPPEVILTQPKESARDKAMTNETKEAKDARMKWWREARFGMFVHWGLYSGLAGSWNGKVVGTRGGMEWIQSYVNADTDSYAEAAIPLFKPKQDFATEWAKLAKEAGCKYVVLTTKHHDGFSLHNSKYTDYDAGSTVERDLIREFVDALNKEGLRVGFYHSVIDWHHDQYEYKKAHGLPYPNRNAPYQEGGRDQKKYIDYLHAQMDELTSNYGRVDVLWWDYSSGSFNGHEAWGAYDLTRKIREKQPNIIMNNRLFSWQSKHSFQKNFSDFQTPEQHIPARGLDSDWETCMTMNTTWGYSDHDHNWKSNEKLIRNLINTASKGGNYLLNIGPKADGSIPPESISGMRAMGEWMGVHSESIYETKASSFEKVTWNGRSTTKYLDDTTILYLHVFERPKNGVLVISGLKNNPITARLLGSTEVLSFKQTDLPAVEITLPEQLPNKIASVIRLEIEGRPEVVKFLQKQDKEGNITLLAADAELHGGQLKFEDQYQCIGYWLNSSQYIDWTFLINKPGTFNVSASIASVPTGKSKFSVNVNGKSLEKAAPVTGSWGKFETIDLGTLKIDKAGETTLSVRPVKKEWYAMNLQFIKLTLVE